MKNADIGGKAGRISRDRQLGDVWVGFFPPVYLGGKRNAIACILNAFLKQDSALGQLCGYCIARP